MISTNDKQIRDILISRANKRIEHPDKLVEFTSDPVANDLICDLENFPHAYVIACILDQQYLAEKVWAIPHELRQRLGTFDVEALYQLPPEELLEAMMHPTKLHRFANKMADAVFLAIQKIHDDYDGDASRIWRDKPSSSTMVRRFREFKYVGPKIATMAANILVRYFGIKVRDFESIDISADVHVIRVFERLGFVPQEATKDEVIQKARRLSPEYPGIFDAEIWHLGREICQSGTPRCDSCYLSTVCQKSFRVQP